MTDSQISQIEAALVAAAGQPRTIVVDGESYTQHALSELLQVYNRAIAAKQATANKTTSGIVFNRFRAGGPV